MGENTPDTPVGGDRDAVAEAKRVLALPLNRWHRDYHHGLVTEYARVFGLTEFGPRDIVRELVAKAEAGQASHAPGEVSEAEVGDRWSELERLARLATRGPWRATRSSRFMGSGHAAPWVADLSENPRRVVDAAYIAACEPARIVELIQAARARAAQEPKTDG